MPANSNLEGPVLFAYDGSESAKMAIERAAQELRSGRAAIVLTAWSPPTIIGAGPAESEIEAGMAAEADRIAAEGAALAREAGFEATARGERGAPVWARIVELADELEASVLVLGSRGLSGVKYVLLGSVATAVAQHTDRPVLIVH
jgi:nucleotide-binding universal stress UspA family protein